MADCNVQQSFDRATYCAYCDDFMSAARVRAGNYLDDKRVWRRVSDDPYHRGAEVEDYVVDIAAYNLKDTFLALARTLTPVPSWRRMIDDMRDQATLEVADKVIGRMMRTHWKLQMELFVPLPLRSIEAGQYAESHGFKNLAMLASVMPGR